MTRHRVYLDTEFTNLNRYTYKLISLALVVPGGSEFYVELTDAWKKGDCSDFVQEIVLPQLDLVAYGRTTEQARIELLDFLQELGPVEIISDAPDWDWPLLVWLAGPGGLPEGVEAGRISGDNEVAAEGEGAPHHALQDARMLAQLVERSNLA
ncbi:TPA: 3'-5' exoribonuclease [Pseudomonas aeruginosa]|uniref:3'-5' exoribonuclease n=1 Tax=Pseudomonadales TaxID=72274 RepID=UPI0015731308|nr:MULTISPECIES: 3'-5' exoribonuclease [Pseudomonas]MBI8031506.1 3'-5' exoribonuclease [Pseudomonas aeruginosa]MCU9198363.1 3'-5' exoribonuclease [Pseudomonas aeruginosa]NTU01926.1 3'-5' exoribonuclease [Pseudomonas aeruginosa]NTU08197.1 3'-5' exoribonuclease [Pseudomonas aeruginosa]UZX34610.1 3'-5' exoribonuclease [Pseudomonas sp. B111]